MDAIASAIAAAKERLPALECRQSELMNSHSSFRIGGPVRAMFLPASAEELCGLCAVLGECGVSPLIIGNGTNLLFDDCTLDLVVIKTTSMCELRRSGETEITADCGVLLSRLAVFACEQGLEGLEFAHGIPGSLGGAVTMNAGAYGGEMKDVIVSTEALNMENGRFSVSGEEHFFSYRHSRFSDTEDVILSSVISLKKGDPKDIRAKMEQLSLRRRESQPLNQHSAGSTFKRPRDGYAAALIDQAGLKGYRVGGAEVSEKHSGFVVNRGGASFSDVMAVVEHVKETVLRSFGIELEPEIKIIRN